MQFLLNASHPYNNRKAISLIAQTDEEEEFLLTIREAMRNGSIEIIAHNHNPSFDCLECKAQRRYRDCVTAEVHLSESQVITT